MALLSPGFYFLIFFVPSRLCDSLCLFLFLMRAPFIFPSPSFLLLSFFAERAAWKVFTLSDNLIGNVLIYCRTRCSAVTGELPPMEKTSAKHNYAHECVVSYTGN